jgi:hypothetical protein
VLLYAGWVERGIANVEKMTQGQEELFLFLTNV